MTTPTIPRLSQICPLCGRRSLKLVCARCALTTAEERDAARAEVARLTTEVEMNKITYHYPGPCTVCGAPAEGMVNAMAGGNWNSVPQWECRCRAHGASPPMTCLPVEDLDALRAEVARLKLLVGFIADLKAQKEHAEYGWSGKESDRHWGDLFDALDAYRAATTGGSDAAT